MLDEFVSKQIKDLYRKHEASETYSRPSNSISVTPFFEENLAPTSWLDWMVRPY